MVIFLSNFLALLIKVDAAGEGNRAGLGGILIAVNMGLIVGVLATSWFATQQAVDDSHDEETSIGLAKTMLTFDQRPAGAAQANREEYHRHSLAFPSGGTETFRSPALAGARLSSGGGAAAPDGLRPATSAATVGTSREEKTTGGVSPSS